MDNEILCLYTLDKEKKLTNSYELNPFVNKIFYGSGAGEIKEIGSFSGNEFKSKVTGLLKEIGINPGDTSKYRLVKGTPSYDAFPGSNLYILPSKSNCSIKDLD